MRHSLPVSSLLLAVTVSLPALAVPEGWVSTFWASEFAVRGVASDHRGTLYAIMASAPSNRMSPCRSNFKRAATASSSGLPMVERPSC